MKKGGHMPVTSPTEILCVLGGVVLMDPRRPLDRDNIPRFS